jgi:hypothetical protein
VGWGGDGGFWRGLRGKVARREGGMGFLRPPFLFFLKMEKEKNLKVVHVVPRCVAYVSR